MLTGRTDGGDIMSTTLDQNNLLYSINMIICEWLEGCFGDPEDEVNRKAIVVADIPQIEDVKNATVGIETRFVALYPSGAGQSGNQTEFRDYATQIKISVGNQTKDYVGKLGADQLSDLLNNHWKNPTVGRTALMSKGLRNITLTGPFTESMESRYYHHWFLKYRVQTYYDSV